LVPQRLGPDDAWGLTFVDRLLCRRQIERLRSDGLYTPPSLRGTIIFPFSGGGVNLLWQASLLAGGQATPMSYVVAGRQFVVVAAGGHSRLGSTLGDAVIAFSLPPGTE
jgi:glucose dehydrogenase